MYHRIGALHPQKSQARPWPHCVAVYGRDGARASVANAHRAHTAAARSRRPGALPRDTGRFFGIGTSSELGPASSAASQLAARGAVFVPDDDDVAWVREVTHDGRAFAVRRAQDRPRLLALGISPKTAASGLRPPVSRQRSRSAPAVARRPSCVVFDGGVVVFRPAPPTSPRSIRFARADTPPPPSRAAAQARESPQCRRGRGAAARPRPRRLPIRALCSRPLVPSRHHRQGFCRVTRARRSRAGRRRSGVCWWVL